MRQHYDHLIKVYRLKIKSGNIRHYVATATADASIQPLGKDRGIVEAGVFGSSYAGYVDGNTSVQTGDQVKDQNGVIYQVTEVVVRDFGAFPYKQLMLKKS